MRLGSLARSWAIRFLGLAVLVPLGISALPAQSTGEVLIVVNKQSRDSREIGEYYLKKRGVPLANLCTIDTPPVEHITRQVYDADIRAPIGRFLVRRKLAEKILYIVTTAGVPLKVDGNADGVRNTAAAVDSELAVLYQQLHGAVIPLAGPVKNPFFQQRDAPFRHPQFPMYLVTRLAAYDMTEMKRLVDNAPLAKNTGSFVIDVRADNNTPGNQWLRTAALLLPKDRVILDDSPAILLNQKNVIGYASWGSNDFDRKQRFLNFQWLPGAIMTEFVSTDGRTFKRPPDNWTIGPWKDASAWFEGAPQTLSADYIHEGASGASGQVDEPYLTGCPRPDFVLPAYYEGRTLAESYYLGIPGLSWMNIVIGDPLMRLKPEQTATIELPMTVEIEGVTLHLAHPDELPVRWVGQEELMRQLLAAWMVVTEQDVPMNPRLIGKPGVGKTTLAYAAARRLGRDVFIMQATMDTRPEDLLITPVIEGAGRLRYVASALVTAMIVGGIVILDEGNRMSEKSWASLAPLLDNRRYVESIVAGIKIKANPNFRLVTTMNDDSSTFELPEYIHSRLQPQILIDFPEKDEEYQILKENIPFAEDRILEYVTDFLQQAHAADERYSVRDGINIARYAIKLKSLATGIEHEKYALETALIETLGEEALRYVRRTRVAL